MAIIHMQHIHIHIHIVIIIVSFGLAISHATLGSIVPTIFHSFIRFVLTLCSYFVISFAPEKTTVEAVASLPPYPPDLPTLPLSGFVILATGVCHRHPHPHPFHIPIRESVFSATCNANSPLMSVLYMGLLARYPVLYLPRLTRSRSRRWSRQRCRHKWRRPPIACNAVPLVPIVGVTSLA